jgi:structural maintenance of chromosome 2
LKENIQKNEHFLNNLDQTRKESTALVQKLEKEVKSFSKDKESRASKIEHMIADQKKKKSKIIDATKRARDDANKEHMQLEAAAEEIKSQQESMKKDEDAAEAEKKGCEECTKKVEAKKKELQRAEDEISKLQAERDSNEKEHTELKKKLDDWKDKKSEAERTRLKVDHVIQQTKQGVQKAVQEIARLKAENPFINTDHEFFGKEGTEYDFQARDVAVESAKLEKMKVEQKHLGNTVNKKVVGMFEKAEEEHRDLCKKREIILQDKGKIKEVIDDLDRKKTEAIKKTYEHVSRDFGNIFSTLLPNVSAKLAVPEGMKCTDGLEIKVAFQGVWKSSLTELSGGQKSLLALSLVLGLLKYKPAPMYILDEIDAALDLSHTQNIGTMIKQHFPEAQFIVVSLKDGMFQNANVLFRTRFIDGCSRVERHELGNKPKPGQPAALEAGKAAAAGEEEESKAQKKGTKRKAVA